MNKENVSLLKYTMIDSINLENVFFCEDLFEYIKHDARKIVISFTKSLPKELNFNYRLFSVIRYNLRILKISNTELTDDSLILLAKK